MTREQMKEVARGNVEAHLGDAASEYESEEAAAEAIFNEAYTLAFDALHDAGVEPEEARIVAQSVALSYSMP